MTTFGLTRHNDTRHFNVSIFDVYAGANLGDGKKSIALSVTLQPVDGTMTDETIEKISGQIIVTVEKQTGGILRG